MAAPEPKPGVPDPHRDDIDDPTGVHALLSSLPGPGPMPQELVERINQTLREEVDRRGDHDDAVSYALFAGRSRRASGGAMWLRVAAVAVVALLLGGGVLMGSGAFGPNVLSMLGGAPTHGPGTAGPTSTGDASRSTPASGSTGATLSPDQSTSRGIDPRVATVLGAQTFHQSNTAYTGPTMLDQARSMVAAPPAPLSPGATEGPYLGPIATPTGLASCLAALDLPTAARATVDLGTYDGKPAAIIVTHAGDHDEVRVVRRSCTTGDPGLLAGPYGL